MKNVIEVRTSSGRKVCFNEEALTAIEQGDENKAIIYIGDRVHVLEQTYDEIKAKLIDAEE